MKTSNSSARWAYAELVLVASAVLTFGLLAASFVFDAPQALALAQITGLVGVAAGVYNLSRNWRAVVVYTVILAALSHLLRLW